MMLPDALVRLIERTVIDLVEGRFEELEADGRSGCLPASALRTAIVEYGRVLTPLPPDWIGTIDVYPADDEPDLVFLDVPLWTKEEGLSDLTLQVAVRRVEPEGFILEIEGIHVL